MARYTAFLRAVNVGGTGKLPMAELRAMCAELGFSDVQTYIASGNLLFTSEASRASVKASLEKRLAGYAGKSVGVVIRTPDELELVLENNPFADKDPRFAVAIFLDEKPPIDALDHAAGQSDEAMSLGNEEIYVYYGSGLARSKLRIPAAKYGTTRNMNTIGKMVELARGRR